jgi:hypothetical protein
MMSALRGRPHDFGNLVRYVGKGGTVAIFSNGLADNSMPR